ncbi:hypothetical protein ACQKPE_03105 [Pseudomonas sp. NPDC089554]|uniref:hypothetical protein n=1 Tax=Pseudomonas sp. NPDC089554 TaxID=3390653 RepID=UPI003D040659
MSRLLHHANERYNGNGEIQESQLEDCTERLVTLHKIIVDSGEVVRKEDSLYEVEIFPGVSVCDVIYGDATKLLSHDCLASFRLMIDQSPILNKQHLDNASTVGTLGLLQGGSANDLTSNDDWVQLVRLDLSLNAKSVKDFYADFSAAFPRLKFSNDFPDCMNSFDGGHAPYAATITRSLASLNDDWVENKNGDLPEMLRVFSSKSRFPTSLEGNGARKKALTFSFSLDRDRSELVLCEPHMKLERADIQGEYCYHRIYFCPRAHDGFYDKILVGHAGRHL